MFFGIRPGVRKLDVDALLYYETKKYVMEKGYQKCEVSMLLEDSDLILRASEFMGRIITRPGAFTTLFFGTNRTGFRKLPLI
jgi:hypothetical protein